MGATQIVTLSSDGYAVNGLKLNGDMEPLESREVTDARNAINVSEYIIHESQSIIPFEGMFAGSNFWQDLPEFLDKYWQETEETPESD
ncbi:MAG: hypothetical protein DMF61_23085 [Blastocatellia bacterium AA13]|nr:MAG: hypothetical protein DMF61_23085 [Blastocatellia bacterium AA13]